MLSTYLITLFLFYNHAFALFRPSGQHQNSFSKSEAQAADMLKYVEEVKRLTESFNEQPSQNLSPREYGVGIALSTSYATVSIVHNNGTVVDIAKLESGPEYQQIMQRLSLDSSKHLTPPYPNYAAAIRDYTRRAERQRRKAQGLPASRDVLIMADLLRSAREEAELFLYHPIDSAIISIPSLPALFAEDVVDALEFINLTNPHAVPTTHNNPILRSAPSTILSLGFGLCPPSSALNLSLSDIRSCLSTAINHSPAYPDVTSLVLSLDRHALTSTLTTQSSSSSFFPDVLSSPSNKDNISPQISYLLGSDANMHTPFYISNLESFITKSITQALLIRRIPRTVYVTGEVASCSIIRDAVARVSKKLMGDMPDIIVGGKRFNFANFESTNDNLNFNSDENENKSEEDMKMTISEIEAKASQILTVGQTREMDRDGTFAASRGAAFLDMALNWRGIKAEEDGEKDDDTAAAAAHVGVICDEEETTDDSTDKKEKDEKPKSKVETELKVRNTAPELPAPATDETTRLGLAMLQ